MLRFAARHSSSPDVLSAANTLIPVSEETATAVDSNMARNFDLFFIPYLLICKIKKHPFHHKKGRKKLICSSPFLMTR